MDSTDEPETPPTEPPANVPRPVLAYAPPLPANQQWFRSLGWSRAALVASLFYCILGIVPPLKQSSAQVAPDALLIHLIDTAPVGILAAVLGVLGHFAPDGRRLAGPAMWICGVTPALIAIATLLANIDKLTPTLIARAALVIAIDATVLWALNGRILREKPRDLIT